MKMNFHRRRNVFLLMTLAFIFYSGFGHVSFSLHTALVGSNDSSKAANFQRLVDFAYPMILNYTDWLYDKAELDSQKVQMESRISSLSRAIDQENKFYDPDSICNAASRNGQTKIKEYLKARINAIIQLETNLQQSNASMLEMQEKTKSLEQNISQHVKEYNLAKDTLTKIASTLEGYGQLKVGAVNYRYYIANSKVDLVRIHGNKKKGIPNSFEMVATSLKGENTEPDMLMNAGMYTPFFTAQGLLIENAKEMSRLDTAKQSNKGNFYLQPNGVFYIDNIGYHINTTDDFRSALAQRKIVPQYATQSGPMLLINGLKNSNIKNRSQNLYIRNGVGILGKNKVIFLISDDPVNFYSFADVFQQCFGCYDALYLDGAISKMYVKRLAKKEMPLRDDGDFGPIISIAKRKK